MPSLPPTIDSKGTITILPDEGLVLPIIEKSLYTEDQVDLSARYVFFSISGGFSKALEVDPNDVKGLVIKITETELEEHLPTSGSTYTLTDRSDPEYPVTLCHGKIVWGDPSWID